MRWDWKASITQQETQQDGRRIVLGGGDTCCPMQMEEKTQQSAAKRHRETHSDTVCSFGQTDMLQQRQEDTTSKWENGLEAYQLPQPHFSMCFSKGKMLSNIFSQYCMKSTFDMQCNSIVELLRHIADAQKNCEAFAFVDKIYPTV